jgi:tetratricopeptide (TPR) repeat protein
VCPSKFCQHHSFDKLLIPEIGGVFADEEFVRSVNILEKAAEHITAGELAQAQSLLNTVLRANAKDPDGLHLMGLVGLKVGKFQAAVSLIESAIALRPLDSGLYSNCGEAYRRSGNLDLAFRHLQRALELNSKSAEAWCNYGNVCREIGRIDEAIAAYRKAIALDERYANAHYNLGLALLVNGNFIEGWREYEYRWKAVPHLQRREYGQPQWKGQSLVQRTLFVYHEQGLGDTLQFVRYLPLMARQGARIILECPSVLHALLQCLDGIQCILPSDPPPAFDYHIPLLSVANVLGANEDTVPREIPYLRAPSETSRTWRERLSQHAAARRIGICWAGNPHHINDRNRSCRLSAMASLRHIEGAIFYSLQKGEAAEQCKYPIPGMKILDYTANLQDFADTAGLIENLDLVVTVDTAVAHLAGALGKPVWMLTPFDPDWRWLLRRNDSPWYPTMKLFRQTSRRNWNSVSKALSDAIFDI